MARTSLSGLKQFLSVKEFHDNGRSSSTPKSGAENFVFARSREQKNGAVVRIEEVYWTCSLHPVG